MTTRVSATVFKRYVSLEMARLREAAGMSRDDVATFLGCSPSHVRHLETLHRLPKVPEIRSLFRHYGIEDRVDEFLELIDAARKGKDWWVRFPGVPQWLELLLGMESAAVSIHSYDTMVVPGLFQIPAYTEALIRAGEPNLPEIEIQPRIDLRMERQDVLFRQPDPPSVWCVLDESVLHRGTGKQKVLHEQVAHLVKLSKLPNVHIQVLPFDSIGIHAGMNGTFTVMTFGPELAGDPGIVYVESRIGGTYYEDPAEILRYRDTWSLVQLHALNPEESRELLVRRVEEIAP